MCKCIGVCFECLSQRIIDINILVIDITYNIFCVPQIAPCTISFLCSSSTADNNW